MDDVNVMHWNINHLTCKLSEVELCIAAFPGIVHVVAIAESWLTLENCSDFTLHGYRDIHNVRKNSEVFHYSYNYCK